MSFLCKMSLANRSIVALITIAILAFGAFVIPSLKEELLPELTYPAISIITGYPGASPEQIEQSITTPLEQNLQGVPGLQQITSSSDQGLSIIIMTYNYGTDLNQAQQTLAQRINTAQHSLPGGTAPQIQSYNIADQPIIRLAVTSADSEENLAVNLQQEVVPVLQGLPGVGNVNVSGIRNQIVSIVLDPTKLQANGISVSQIQSALQANNISLPVGEVTAGTKTSTIRVDNTLNSLQSIKDIVVGERATTPTQVTATGAAGQVIPGQAGYGGAQAILDPTQLPTTQFVKLSDVAKIQQILAPSTTLTRTNGKPSLGIAITKTNDANTVSLSLAVKAQIPELERKLGSQAQITIISDQAPYIQSAIESLSREGMLGAGFAILVILAFLFSLRSTLVTAISIPLSIVIALIALWASDLSLNILTLGGLTIAVGRVVDDSIVVLENIYRHLHSGEEKLAAVLNGVREVAGAVTASTITTVAVFLPIAFTTGIVGEFFRPFSFTVTIALLASLFVSLTIIPVLAYWFLYVSSDISFGYEKKSMLEERYVPIVKWAIQHRVITLLCAVFILAGSLALYPLLPTNLFSSSSQNTFSFNQQMAPGTSLAQANKAASKVEKVLNSIPEIKEYQVTIGASAGSANGDSGINGAGFAITTDPDADQLAVQQDVRNRLHNLSDIGSITFASSAQGTNSTLTVNVQAADPAALKTAAQQVFQVVSDTPDTNDVTSNLADAAQLIDVRVNSEKALAVGLTAAQVSQTLRMIYTGTTVTQVTLNGRQQDVDMTMNIQAATIQKIQDIQLPGAQGRVRLGDIATVKSVTGPTQITHIATNRSASINAQVAGENVGAVSSDVQKRLDALKLPNGASVSMGGITVEQNDAFRSLGMALAAAILLVYLVMVATFRSLLQPIILLISIPFAGTGSIVLLLATHTALGAPALIGLLMLIGIVVTNAIVLLDLIDQYRRRGLDARNAVVEGGRRRLRPILMTAIATILALTPMALGLNGSSGFISGPLAIVVIGGLSTSTVLTLLLVPTLYVAIEDIRGRFHPTPPKRMGERPHQQHEMSRAKEEQQFV
ncbi:MAG TPA: efflux RND transporter permease subunit [Ktedonobacteraceae bacterium]|nr:efflux RND transporter permease subunit [Ktedonobacteraceae bacterium]